jgi:hypothetical protein
MFKRKRSLATLPDILSVIHSDEPQSPMHQCMHNPTNPHTIVPRTKKYDLDDLQDLTHLIHAT